MKSELELWKIVYPDMTSEQFDHCQEIINSYLDTGDGEDPDWHKKSMNEIVEYMAMENVIKKVKDEPTN